MSSRESLMNDIEEVPYEPSMISDYDDDTSHTCISSQEYQSIKKKQKERTNEQAHVVPYKRLNEYFEKVSMDLNHLSVSIASTIESPEQWIEFCQNTGGLETILNCIHDTVEEIKGRSIPINHFEPLLCPDDMNGFRTACCACRVLRDLCAKDTMWASAITDEILELNQKNGNATIFSDLVFLLRHTNEAERIYSQRAWRMRRIMKRNGFYTSNLKSRKERRGKTVVRLLVVADSGTTFFVGNSYPYPSFVQI
jgi:hypothetical protein